MSMNMVFAYLNSECLKKALDPKQGLIFVYTFEEKRNHMTRNKVEEH